MRLVTVEKEAHLPIVDARAEGMVQYADRAAKGTRSSDKSNRDYRRRRVRHCWAYPANRNVRVLLLQGARATEASLQSPARPDHDDDAAARLRRACATTRHDNVPGGSPALLSPDHVGMLSSFFDAC